LKVLGDITPVNLIDIPSQTPIEIVEKIYGVTDLLIIHSWKDIAETEKMIIEIRKKFKIENVVCFLRDCKNK
jgi:hypothetical protein